MTHVLDTLTGFKTWHARCGRYVWRAREHHIPDPWKFVRIEFTALLIVGTCGVLTCVVALPYSVTTEEQMIYNRNSSQSSQYIRLRGGRICKAVGRPDGLLNERFSGRRTDRP